MTHATSQLYEGERGGRNVTHATSQLYEEDEEDET